MKEIFEKIYMLMEGYFKGFADWEVHFGEDMKELKKLIDVLEEAKLTPREREAAEEIIGKCE